MINTRFLAALVLGAALVTGCSQQEPAEKAVAAAEQSLADIHERGVTLRVTGAEGEHLPRPSENPAVMEVDPADTVSGKLSSKLRRAWDLLSGDY